MLSQEGAEHGETEEGILVRGDGGSTKLGFSFMQNHRVKDSLLGWLEESLEYQSQCLNITQQPAGNSDDL